MHCNLLLYCGSVIGGIATLVAVIISTTHADYIEKRRRIPFLVISYKTIPLQTVDDYPEETPKIYFSDSETDDFINSYRSHVFSVFYEVENSVLCIAVQNIKKDIGVLDFSIKVEDNLITNNKFIKPNDEFVFILGCSAGYLQKNGEKTIRISYRYQSEDMDQKYEQTSDVRLFFKNDSPMIEFKEPVISERKEIIVKF